IGLAPVVICCFHALSGHKKQHALLEAVSGRGSRLSSSEAYFCVARRGAEASTVGVNRAELHKRALQWERTTAYLAPGKACRGNLMQPIEFEVDESVGVKSVAP